MKSLFFASLFIALLAPQCDYAADALSHHSADHQHHIARHHSTLKNDNQPVDINHADANALMTLKGIGMKKANTIITYRQSQGAFQTIEDLSKVKGVGVKGLKRLEAMNPGRLVLK